MNVLAASTALLLALGLGSAAHAQSGSRNAVTASPDATRYEYCEVRVSHDEVFADFGYGSEKLGGGKLSKLEVGKLQVFATPISALNYLGSLGWEVIQTYQPNSDIINGLSQASNSRYYVLRRLRSSTGINVTK